MFQRLKPPATALGSAWGFTKGAAASAFLFGTLLPINLLQLLGVGLMPFWRTGYRRLNRWCADTWWGLCLDLLVGVYGMRTGIQGDELPAGENAIVVCNHQQMADIPVLMVLARRLGRLGDMKWIVKHGLKYVPLVGWGMQMLGCLFVKRLWAEDREKVLATFSDFHREKLPIWLISFPEGTRITESKLVRSQRFAEKAGMPKPEHVLLPRTKGFVAAVEGLRGHATAVYDVTMGFPDGIPTLWQMFRGEVRDPQLFVRRYPLASLPEDREALAEWLNARFVEKDRLMAAFRRDRRFPATREPGEKRHIQAHP